MVSALLPVQYRIHRVFSVVAIVGLCYCSLDLLSVFGFIPPLPTLLGHARSRAHTIVMGLSWWLSLSLMTSFRVKVRLDESGIHWIGFLKSGTIRWDDILEIAFPERSWAIRIRTEVRTIELLRFQIGPGRRRLLDDLAALISQRAPAASVVHVA